jgi:hypothetical protein
MKKSGAFERKSAQVTIFIIIAIVIVAGVVLFFVFRQKAAPSVALPREFQPVYDSFSACLEQQLRNGIDILGTQGGYIYTPAFEPGSSYAPFSSQLDFHGNAVPYWLYLSGNGQWKEQVPTKSVMEQQLEQYLSDQISLCKRALLPYTDQGFVTSMASDEARADVAIQDTMVDAQLNMDFAISDGISAAVVSQHKAGVNSQLGRFYNTALGIYRAEQRELFLEDYTIDTLRLNAPVDGVEVSCAPKIWVAQDVFDELQSSIELNILALKTKGNYYTLNDQTDKYFVAPADSGSVPVQFLQSRKWPYKIEVWPSERGLMTASPIGNQPGLGILGFCYAPYHFVYDVHFPVLVQLYSTEEIFQFPIAVVIRGNNPRNPLQGAEAVDYSLPSLCENRGKKISVSVFDTSLRPVSKAEISYECFGVRCDIGITENGIIRGDFPACTNGFLRVRAEGYIDAKVQCSTNQGSCPEVILDRAYELQVVLRRDGAITNDRSIVTFDSLRNKITIVYPEETRVKLGEGQYTISVQNFGNASFTLPAQTSEQCVEVPRTGLGGLFGATKKQCFEISVPAQTITEALRGGGTQEYYIAESELQGARNVEIDFQSFRSPRSLEDLQSYYDLAESQGLNIVFI